MLSDWITKLDFEILDWIAGHVRGEFLDFFFPLVTFLGNKGWIFIVLAVLLFLLPKSRIWGAKLGISLLLGFLFGNIILKNAVMRIRPYDVAENIELLVDKLKDYSFPSGHAMAAFEFCTAVCCMPVKKRYKMLAVLFSLTMAFSRLYLYVHYPTDVLGGAVFGVIFGIMGVRIADAFVEEKYGKKGL